MAAHPMSESSRPGNSGDLDEFNRDPLGFLCRRAREDGDVARMDLGNVFYLLNRPEDIAAVLQDKPGIFTKTLQPADFEHNHDPQSLKYAAFQGLLGHGLLTTDGDDWRRRRRILAPPFQPKPTQGYAPAITSLCERVISSWDDGQSIDVYEQMRELTLQVVGTTLMGSDLSDRAEDEGKHFRAALDHFYQPSREDVPFEQALARLHQTADAIVADRRAGGDHGDLLSRLLRDVEARALSDGDLRNELMTLLFAGHETTANAFCWTWLLLARNPDKEARLALELNSVLLGRAPAAEDLERLPYTQAVINESLRLFPPVWFLGRFLQADWTVGEHRFDVGCGVMVSPWVTQRDPRYFADPERFEPERWADDLERRLPRGVYFPFGDGPRVCIGRPLALLELVLVVATIAQRFRLSLAGAQDVAPEPLNTIRPAGGLVMELSRR
jgi:cytochrome P450